MLVSRLPTGSSCTVRSQRGAPDNWARSLEFSARRLAHIGKAAALAGVIQVGATTAVMLLISLALGQSLPRALFFGMAIALSSTAIVLRSLQERAEVDAPHGRLVLGTLIVQDLAIVPMILIVPLLAGEQSGF